MEEGLRLIIYIGLLAQKASHAPTCSSHVVMWKANLWPTRKYASSQSLSFICLLIFKSVEFVSGESRGCPSPLPREMFTFIHCTATWVIPTLGKGNSKYSCLRRSDWIFHLSYFLTIVFFTWTPTLRTPTLHVSLVRSGIFKILVAVEVFFGNVHITWTLRHPPYQ